MAEENEGEPQYRFTTENNETKFTSRGYSGRAIANYPNGDIYDGYFVEGQRDVEVLTTTLSMVKSLMASGLIIQNMVLVR